MTMLISFSLFDCII